MPGPFGLNRARNLLYKYIEAHGSIPAQNEFPTIARMCENLRWNRWGISSWEDLMQETFNNFESRPPQ
ncbi:MAG: hypothetical protein ACTSRK_16885 [Promethearchaeota archaeon]